MTRRLRRILVPALLVAAAVGIASMVAVPDERPIDDLTAEDIARIDDFVERFQIGQRLFGSGRDDEAERVFRDLLAEAPDAAAVNHALGTLLQFRKRPAEATRFLLRAAELAPKDVAIQRDAGLDLLRAGRPADAEPYLARARKIWPEDVEILVAHATSLRAVGRSDAARAAYRAALVVQPESVDAGVGLASAIVATQPAEAAKLVEPLSHNFADVALVHGLAMVGMQRPAEALPLLARAATRAPRNAGGRAVLAAAARALADLGAAQETARASALWCEQSGAPPALEPSLLLAQALAAFGKPAEAYQALEQARVEGADAAVVRRGRLVSGSLLARTGHGDEARGVLSVLADEEHASPERALARRALGRTTAAELKTALAGAPARRNDAAWAEAVTAWLTGDDAAAARHAARCRELSDTPGEFPALLVR